MRYSPQPWETDLEANVSGIPPGTACQIWASVLESSEVSDEVEGWQDWAMVLDAGTYCWISLAQIQRRVNEAGLGPGVQRRLLSARAPAGGHSSDTVGAAE